MSVFDTRFIQQLLALLIAGIFFSSGISHGQVCCDSFSVCQEVWLASPEPIIVQTPPVVVVSPPQIVVAAPQPPSTSLFEAPKDSIVVQKLVVEKLEVEGQPDSGMDHQSNPAKPVEHNHVHHWKEDIEIVHKHQWIEPKKAEVIHRHVWEEPQETTIVHRHEHRWIDNAKAPGFDGSQIKRIVEEALLDHDRAMERRQYKTRLEIDAILDSGDQLPPSTESPAQPKTSNDTNQVQIGTKSVYTNVGFVLRDQDTETEEDEDQDTETEEDEEQNATLTVEQQGYATLSGRCKTIENCIETLEVQMSDVIKKNKSLVFQNALFYWASVAILATMLLRLAYLSILPDRQVFDGFGRGLRRPSYDRAIALGVGFVACLGLAFQMSGCTLCDDATSGKGTPDASGSQPDVSVVVSPKQFAVKKPFLR